MKNVDDVYPLSPTQEGILFHCVSEPTSGHYVEQVVWRLTGPVDRPALERAWNEAISRHAILRTAFFWERLERPHQVVRRHVTLLWQHRDWRGVSGATRDDTVASFLEADRRRGFTLTQPPLLRVTWIRLGADLHQFVFTYHHLLMDARSVSHVLQEVSASYEAFRSGRTPRLADRRPYRDYISWLEQQDLSAAQTYWSNRLDHAPPCLMSADATPARGETGSNDHPRYVTCHEQWEGVERLSAVARDRGVTVGALVHAAWALLLHRYTGSADVTFGTVVSGRAVPLSGVESMIGVFVNTLPLRLSVESNEPASALIDRVHRRILELRRFEAVPLTAIHKWTRQATSLFDTLLVFDLQLETTGGVQRLFHSDARTGYPLVLEAYAGRTLVLSATVDERRLQRTTAARLLQHLSSVFEALVAHGSAPAGDSFQPPSWERHQILVEWNDTAQEWPRNATLHGLIEAQAARSPEAIAVVMEDESITYAELNGRANRLAHALIERGVGAESRVALSAVRSLDMVCSLLGILKAGAAYVPLDPDHPEARRRFIIHDADVAAVVCDEQLALEWRDSPVAMLSPDGAQASGLWPRANPRPDVSAEQAAYLLYTSGSTGSPKAVVNTHAGIVNRILWMQQAYELHADDRVLQKTPLSFDVSVWEVCWPLAAGGRVVLARPGGHRDPAYLAEAIDRHAVTVVHFVPSMLRAFIEATATIRCRSLRHIFSSGEALPYDVEQRVLERLGTPLHNLYGPTEAAVDATFSRCRRSERPRVVPIGRPIANVRIHIVDRNLQPQPIGVAGELCIAGRGLARGYRTRPDLTADAFVPDPFDDAGGARLYRTGDRARYLPDGTIEFLGRFDHRVKVGGVRIEPGEIEAALRAHPDVGDAVVLQDARHRLIAYTVPRDRCEPTRTELQAWLGARLPLAMRPAGFVFLQSLPLSPNGKLDRRQLPAVPDIEVERAEGPIAPRTVAEQALAAIWSQVLGIRDIGSGDNFLALGGDSILALRVIAAAARSGMIVSLPELLDRTLADVAAAAHDPGALVNRESASGEDFPLTPVQQAFFDQNRVDPHHFNQSIVLALTHPIESSVIQRAAAQLQACHEALRLRFRWRDNVVVQCYAPPTVVAPFSYLDLSALPPARHETVLADLQASLDLERGPVWRLTQREDGHLHVIAHHLVIDTLSWPLLLEGLSRAIGGEDLEWPARITSYRDWALALVRTARSEEVELDRAFWLEQVRRPVAPIVRNDPSGENVEASARTVTVELSAENTRVLVRHRRRVEGVLLTALAHAWTAPSQADIVVDVESQGRNPQAYVPDVSRTVGWFAAIFPLRLPRASGLLLPAMLREVERRRAAAGHSGFGYGALRTRSRETIPSSPAEVLFNYIGAFEPLPLSADRVRLADATTGPVRSPRARRQYLFEIIAGIVDGRLRLDWTFSDNVHKRAQVERLAAAMVDAVASLVPHLDTPSATSDLEGLPGVIDDDINDRDVRRLTELLARSQRSTST